MAALLVTRATFHRDGTDFDRILERANGRLALLRHDTCGAPTLAPSLAFAAMEKERGVRATYFIHDALPGFGTPRVQDDVRRLRDLGHGIGLHYAPLLRMLRDGAAPADSIRRSLDALRASGEVTMAAAHGHAAHYHHGAREYEVWEEFDSARNEGGGAATWLFERLSLRDLELVEVYLDGDYTASLSDSRGVWTGWRGLRPRPFERIDARDNLGLAVLDDPLEGERLAWLAHPVWWHVS